MTKSKIMLNLHLVKETPAEIIALLCQLLKSRSPDVDETVIDLDDDAFDACCKYFHLPEGPILPFLEKSLAGSLDYNHAHSMFPKEQSWANATSIVQFSSEPNCEFHFYYIGESLLGWPNLYCFLQFLSPWIDDSQDPAAVRFDVRNIDDSSQQPITHIWFRRSDGLYCSRVEGGDLDHGLGQFSAEAVYDSMAEVASVGELVELPDESKMLLESYGSHAKAYIEVTSAALDEIYREMQLLIAGDMRRETIQVKLHTAMNKMIAYVYQQSLQVDCPSKMYLMEVPLYDACMKIASHKHWDWSVPGKTFGPIAVLKQICPETVLRMFHNVNEDFCSLQRFRMSEVNSHI